MKNFYLFLVLVLKFSFLSRSTRLKESNSHSCLKIWNRPLLGHSFSGREWVCSRAIAWWNWGYCMRIWFQWQTCINFRLPRNMPRLLGIKTSLGNISWQKIERLFIRKDFVGFIDGLWWLSVRFLQMVYCGGWHKKPPWVHSSQHLSKCLLVQRVFFASINIQLFLCRW